MQPHVKGYWYKGKRVELFYLSNALPKHIDMTTYAHYSKGLLEFINVEAKTIDIDAHIKEVLIFIKNWHTKYHESNYFLGAPWLKGELSKELKIFSNDCSTLLEKLRTEKLIDNEVKNFDDGTSKSRTVHCFTNVPVSGYMKID